MMLLIVSHDGVQQPSGAALTHICPARSIGRHIGRTRCDLTAAVALSLTANTLSATDGAA